MSVCPALLVAHPWAGELAESLWRCARGASVLRPAGPDPICPGCQAEIKYADVTQIERYCGDWMAGPIGQEALAWQLDILAAGKDIAAREERFRRVPTNRREPRSATNPESYQLAELQRSRR